MRGLAMIRRKPGEVPGSGRGTALSIGLGAVIVAASEHEPRVLTIRHSAPSGAPLEALPAGPLEAEHRTLELGLRSWVERQTSQSLGYVEQLYTFGDRDRLLGASAAANPALTVAYLALVREVRPAEIARRLGDEPGLVEQLVAFEDQLLVPRRAVQAEGHAHALLAQPALGRVRRAGRPVG